MKKLSFPIIDTSSFNDKCLSMDEYLHFVSFHLQHTFNKRAYRYWKKLTAVNVPFFW